MNTSYLFPLKIQCGSWLACDACDSVLQLNRGDAIAGKPVPTENNSTCQSAVILLIMGCGCAGFR
ncbi:hypothetical protein FJ692_11685 [Pseudomonas fluorescens]|nr:hypothetical protein C1751_20395 [Pseudomonas fluorescens]PRW76583.1 hypothetical protein C7A12_14505 [Pseudomonas fluorescens]PRW78341.1 hypothetical protein C7A13_14115 [Pseudomonas fluorescens]TPV57588.1 hypothetical protein FJ692_11685 [Pseudomonas fluorescens]